MISLPGYETLKLIYQSTNSQVYRALDQKDNRAVILKALKQDYPTASELTRYKQEYQLTSSLSLEGVVKAYGLQPYQNTLVIILEDFGGQSLKNLQENHQFSLSEVLEIFINVAESLGQLHAANIIHKDINPANIVINRETGQLKLIDLGISTRLTKENPTLKNPNVLEGTLAYISPEQTGRMNRSLDYRTDFYSLGVSLYESLTGELPFPIEDELELVYSHIAKQLQKPANVPPILADIISKLMSKNAEDRYQSAWGLKSDLANCLSKLESTTKIESFPLGKNDISDRFQIPQKLYGRQKEIQELIQAFDRVTEQSEIMLIAGYSGIGKSALVQEIYKPITEKRGYFISGKFDQFQRNIPYSAIVSAFKEFIQQLLTETGAHLEEWKSKFLQTLGANGQVLIDVIPEIELIIGKQPAVEKLGPTEAQNRFNLVFQNFIRTCCTKDHPLVIFLDDLQWTDRATLKLIELMMRDKNLKNLFLIGAYRDNEVNANHPLIILVNELGKSEVVINQVTLTNLALEDITHLIVDTIDRHDSKVDDLAELIKHKTGGNPFFANQFLMNLYTENLLKFDYPDQEWQWDLGQIKAQNITDNVVELMIGKLRKLEAGTQDVLKLAACIGASFDLHTLTIVAEQSAPQIFDELVLAVQSGLVLSLSELDSKLLIQEYRFLHDRVQQAAYALIPEEDKQSIHLKIGQLLLHNTSADKQDERLFDIIGHLNIGLCKIRNEVEKKEAIALNLKAAKKAKLATAYQGSLEYLKAGIQALTDTSWEEDYELTFDLYKERCEVEYLSGDFDRSKHWADLTLLRAKTELDKCEIYGILILQNIMVARYHDAFVAGRAGLELLGVTFPDFDASISEMETCLNQEIDEINEILKTRSIASLEQEKEIENPAKKMIATLLCHSAPATFFKYQNLWYIVIAKTVNLSFNYGVVVESTCGLGSYAMFLSSHLEEYAMSYQFGDVAVKIAERFDNSRFKCQSLHLFSTYVSGWNKHLKFANDLNDEAFAAGLESGEFIFAGYTLMMGGVNLFYQGLPLDRLEETLAQYYSFTQECGHRVATDLILGCSLVIHNLRGLTAELTSFNSDRIEENDYIQKSVENNSYMGLCYFYILKFQALYLYGYLSEARKVALAAEELLLYISISIGVAQHNFYYSLTLLALYPEGDATTQQNYLNQIQANQLRMKKWADNCPENYLHKFLLVEAEIARNLGNIVEAMNLYDRAIKLAKDNNFIQEEALINELAAQFYLSLDKPKFANLYLQEARYGYQRWGAIAKVNKLEENYITFLQSTPSLAQISETITQISTESHSGTTLDIATIIKANQAISGEIVLEKLLMALMKIILQNTGAQMGYLILADRDKLTIEASKSLDSDKITVLQGTLVEDSHILPQTLVNYVARTQESVVLNDAANTGNFINDSYIKTSQPKSVLCVPLINQGKLVSLVYLENNLTTGAFTEDRVEIIQLLSGQAAIALENAYLYQTLEKKVEERTAELGLANQEIGMLNEKLKAENIRLSSEIAVAQKIQQMVLPKPAELDDISSLDIAGYMEPADEVGGDYYDILQQGNQLKISIGDVTGHGLESGVLMLMAQTAVRTLQKVNETDPIKFLDLLNQTLYDNLQRMNSDKNMTLSIVDYQDGVMTLSGQHEELIVVRSHGEVEQIDTIDLGFPIGLDSDIAEFISQQDIHLYPEDIVVLYTDGITEAANLNNDQYGLEKLCRVVVQYRDRAAAEIREQVIKDVREFIGEQKVFDDITLVILKQK